MLLEECGPSPARFQLLDSPIVEHLLCEMSHQVYPFVLFELVLSVALLTATIIEYDGAPSPSSSPLTKPYSSPRSETYFTSNSQHLF